MKYIKISLLLFLVLVSFHNTVFGGDVKIYTIDEIILNSDGFFCDKISN